MSARKKIIIAGATSGIGKEMAAIFAKQNHLVGATGRRENFLHQLKENHPQQVFISCFAAHCAASENFSIQKLLKHFSALAISKQFI